MFTVIGFMIAGIFIGYAARRIRFPRISLLITDLIWVLLFLLGWEVGHNEEVISSLPTLGLDALLLTLATLSGSCFAAWGLWRLVNKKERLHTGKAFIYEKKKEKTVRYMGKNSIDTSKEEVPHKEKEATCKKGTPYNIGEDSTCEEGKEKGQ